MNKQITFIGWKCDVKFFTYQNGRTAIQLFDSNDHEPVCTATVNLPDAPLPDGYVFIKDWSENAGIYDALLNANIIGPVEGLYPTGHVAALMCPLIKETIQ